jgi:AcrR family transcriptional regulator
MGRLQSVPRSLPPPPAAAKPGLTRRARHSAETRERLYCAALRLFAERGFAATTVEDITEAADVGKGTFFNYFPAKEHVLASFGESRVGLVAAWLAEARRTKAPIEEILRRGLVTFRREPEQNPALMCSMMVANLTNDALRKILRSNLIQARRHLERLLALGQKRGEIRRDIPAGHLAAAFQEAFFGAQVICSVERSAPLAAWFDSTFAVFWAGVAVRGTHRGSRGKRSRAKGQDMAAGGKEGRL